MAEKTIVKNVLAIAKERDKQQEQFRLEELENALLKLLQNDLNKTLNYCFEWTAMSGTTSQKHANISNLEISFTDISNYDLETAGKNIGLNIRVEDISSSHKKFPSYFDYQIIDTKNVKENIMTPAQKMLQLFNIELLHRIDSQRNSAESYCKKILNKLNSGDFISEKDVKQKRWIIKVEADTSIPSDSLAEPFENKTKEILKHNGFYEFSFMRLPKLTLRIPFEEE